MKSTMEILHIASFNGNIGDNASHNGLYRIMDQIGLNTKIHYNCLEMRGFYNSWRQRCFESDEFVRQCNENDLVILGGGNYFEAIWDYSRTGTNFDISLETLGKIKTPILFNSIGIDLTDSGSLKSKERFKNFLEFICSSDQYLINIRNDGSYRCIRQLVGKDQYKHVHHVFDSAFFAETNHRTDIKTKFDFINKQYKILGINTCKDRLSERWYSSSFTYDSYVTELSEVVNQFLDAHKEYAVVFFPHIYSDLEAISDILKHIRDDIRRIRIFVAPLLTGQGSEKEIIHIYSLCNVILAMRFHANVISITQNISTIGLCCHPRIRYLYEEIGMNENLINVNVSFAEVMRDKLEFELHKKEICNDFQIVIERMGSRIVDLIKTWLKKHNLCVLSETQ